MNEIPMTLIGALTADPELRYSQAGLAVVNLTIASNPRTFDKQTNAWKDGEATFIRCSAWRQLAENIAASLTKGTRVVATGTFSMRPWETKDGEKRTSPELQIQAIGPELAFATASVTKLAKGDRPPHSADLQPNGPQGGYGGGQQQGGGGFGGGQQRQQQEEPWAPSAPAGGDVWSTPGSYNDETPF